jgi:hypothetical protein
MPGSGVVGLLERTVWKTLQYRSLEDNSTIHNVVYLERTQCANSKDCERTVTNFFLIRRR